MPPLAGPLASRRRVEAGAACLLQSFEDAAHAVQPGVVAAEFGEVRVRQVEHEVGSGQVLVGGGEVGADGGSDLCDEVKDRLLC